MHRLARPSAVIAPLLLATTLFVACKGGEQSGSSATGDIGGTVVISTAADAGTLMPQIAAGITDRQVTDLLYDHLAEIGQDLNTVGDKGFIPQLAQKWEWSADSLSITFHLDPRAKWHDGQPVRASDVRYSVSLIKDPAMGAQAGPLLANIDSVSVKDSVTVVAWFKRHVPEEFYDLVYQVAIVPEHIFASIPAAQIKTAEASRTGIGSGRFRLVKWDAGNRIELIADTANYRGRPKLDRVVYAVSPDFNGAATRFLSGEADVFENLRPEQIKQIENDTSRRVVPLPALTFNYLAFNAKDPKAPTKPHPIFSDRAVRRALSMAVDRRAMSMNVFGRTDPMSYGPFARALAVSDTTWTQIPFDTVKARALLDSAGWRTGADGIRSRNGMRLAFSITTPNSSAGRKSYAVLLQEAFRRVGADVKLDEVDFPGYMQKITTHTFDTEMASFSPDPSVSGAKQVWGTSGIGKDGNNFYSYSNPKVDALLDSATTSFDPAKTKSLARRAFEIIIDDAPAIWLYEPPTIAGMSKRVHPVKLRADAYFSGLADWWIPANERNARDKIGLHPAP